MPHERCALCGIDRTPLGISHPAVIRQQVQNLEQVLADLRQGQIHEAYVRKQSPRMCLLCFDAVTLDDDGAAPLDQRIALVVEELRSVSAAA
jgi:hypothetical protein